MKASIYNNYCIGYEYIIGSQRTGHGIVFAFELLLIICQKRTSRGGSIKGSLSPRIHNKETQIETVVRVLPYNYNSL